jgi:hypothetical protein
MEIAEEVMHMSLLRPLLGIVFAAGLAAAADPALLNLVMKDPRMVAGLDAGRAKNSPFGARILAEMKEEDPGFQKFVSATGFDPRRDLREVVLASDGEGAGSRTLLVVKGVFDEGRIAAWLRSEGAKSSLYRGVDVWSTEKRKHADDAFALLGGTLAVFGREASVREAIDRRGAGGSQLSGEMAARVAEWSGRCDAWFVSATPLEELGIGKGGGNAILPGGLNLGAVRQAAAGVRFGGLIEVSGDFTARSEKDAEALGDVFRFVASMIRLNAKPGMEDALKAAESLRVSIAGASAKFTIEIPEELVEKLIGNRRKPAGKRPAEVI